jgi:hypothetical protein
VPRKKNEIQTIRVEVMPPENPNAPRLGPDDAKKLLKDLVQKQVAEIMAQRDEFLFQPFFQQKKVADEIKRMQTVPEQNKWNRYYDRWGCLTCRTRKFPHCSLGMCANCHGRIFHRLKSVIADTKETIEQPEDIEATALRALLPGSTEETTEIQIHGKRARRRLKNAEKPDSVAAVKLREAVRTLLNAEKPGSIMTVEFREKLRAIVNSD